MDISGKKRNLDVKYLHPFSPNSSSNAHNGHRLGGGGAGGGVGGGGIGGHGNGGHDGGDGSLANLISTSTASMSNAAAAAVVGGGGTGPPTPFQSYTPPPNLLNTSCAAAAAADSAFKKIKLLQESSLEHHPTSVSCPTPARRRHRTTFTQVRRFFLCLLFLNLIDSNFRSNFKNWRLRSQNLTTQTFIAEKSWLALPNSTRQEFRYKM